MFDWYGAGDAQILRLSVQVSAPCSMNTQVNLDGKNLASLSGPTKEPITIPGNPQDLPLAGKILSISSMLAFLPSVPSTPRVSYVLEGGIEGRRSFEPEPTQTEIGFDVMLRLRFN